MYATMHSTIHSHVMDTVTVYGSSTRPTTDKCQNNRHENINNASNFEPSVACTENVSGVVSEQRVHGGVAVGDAAFRREAQRDFG